MENETIIGLVLAIIAILGFAGLGVNAYYNQLEEVDLNGIIDNSNDINSLEEEIVDMREDIEDIEMEVTQDDLDDLKDDLEKYARKYAGDDGEDGEDGIGLDKVIQCAEDAKYNNYTSTYPDFIDCLTA